RRGRPSSQACCRRIYGLGRANSPVNPDPHRTEAGVWCRACGSLELWVVETSHAEEGVVRRRKCRRGGTGVLTLETILGMKDRGTIRGAFPPVSARGSTRAR